MSILDLIERETGHAYHKVGTSGNEYAGQCPWCGGHGGRNGNGGRFRIWLGEGRYWCRECGRRGDAIQFVRNYKLLPFAQAKEFLGLENDCDNNIHHNHHNHHNHSVNHHHHDNAQPLQSPCPAWTEHATTWLNDCQAALWDARGVKAVAWLRGRGLHDGTIQGSGLGYNPVDHYTERATWGLQPEKNDRGQPRRLWLPRGVLIPWIVDGALWGLRIRRSAGEPRYYWLPGGTPNAIYNADALIAGKPVVVLEGEIDALTVCQADHVGVATGSTNAARRTRWLARLATASVVLVAYDADDAGEKAAAYWVGTLDNAKRWRPYWRDANQLAQDGVNVRAWIEAGLKQGQTTDVVTVQPVMTPAKVAEPDVVVAPPLPSVEPPVPLKNEMVLLPGHTEPWSIDYPAAPVTAYGRATQRQMAEVARQMADQEVEPKQRYRLATIAGFNNIEAATIAAMVRDSTWRAILTKPEALAA